MPQIRPITDLRNTNEISEICTPKRNLFLSLKTDMEIWWL